MAPRLATILPLLFGVANGLYDLPTVDASGTLNVGIIIMPGIFISEATIPFDMYVHVPNNKMKVYFVAETMDPITTYYGTRLKPDYTTDNAPAADILVVPSGIGSHHKYLTAWYGGAKDSNDNIVGKTTNSVDVTYYGNMTKLMNWVTTTASSAKIVTSHCWGAFTLAGANVLDGKKATTFPGYTDDLKLEMTGGSVIADKRWVVDGKIMTSNGAVAAFEACLAVIRHIYGDTIADGIVSGLVISPENVGHSKDEYFKVSPSFGDLPEAKKTKVGILLLEGTFISEPTAPFDVFAHVDSPAGNVEVYFVGETMDPIQTYYKATMYPDYTVATAPQPDILVVPSAGGSMTTDLDKTAVINWIKTSAASATWVTSHCWGAFLLCKADLCDGKVVTTFPGYYANLTAMFPKIKKVVEDNRIVQDGNLVTSNGGVAAYEAAGYVVGKHFGAEWGKEVAKGLVYSGDNYKFQEDAYVEPVVEDTSGAARSAAFIALSLVSSLFAAALA